MPTISVRCSECGRTFSGRTFADLDYVQTLRRGKLRPVCRECYEDFRSEQKKETSR